MTKLQIAHNQKFIAALRSGKYQQGRRRLRDGNKYCCLGVACEVFRQSTRQGKWNGNSFTLNGNPADVYTPNLVTTWFGWGFQNPDIKIDGVTSGAADHNDTGRSFKQIAQGFERLVKAATKAG